MVWMILAFLVYWIVCAYFCDKAERKSMLYPAFRYQIWAIAPLVGFIYPFYLAVHGLMSAMDKDYREKSKSGQDDNIMGASAMLALYVGVHIVMAVVMRNTPPELETAKFTGENGLVCYAHMKKYNDDKPYIAHSHCEVGRTIASKEKSE